MSTLGIYYPSAGMAVAIVRSDGMAFDWSANTYAALPASGIPSAGQLKAMTKPVAAGPLAGNFFLDVPTGYLTPQTFLAFFPTDANGVPSGQVDLWPYQYVMPILGVPGGRTA